MNRLMFRSLITALALLVLFCVPSIASADGVSVVWTLSATLNDGGTASGHFTYDGTTYSSIDITTSPGSPLSGSLFGGAEYTSVNAIFPPTETGVIFMTGDSSAFLFLLFDGLGLTDSGGKILLMTGDGGSDEGTCTAGCTEGTELRTFTAGEVVGTVPTPEPSALSLLGIGLLALLSSAAIRKASHV
jgi:PEP-CTERM motif